MLECEADEKDKKISDLEAKLAESKEQLIAMNEKSNKIKKESYYLKQQLAEKEKENNELEFIVEEIEQFAWEQLNNDNFDKYKAYDEMYTKIKQLTKNSPYEEHNKDKISFALEQLEKVKELLNTDFESTISWIDPYEDGGYLNSMTYNHNNTIKIIDNQINELKGEQ